MPTTAEARRFGAGLTVGLLVLASAAHYGKGPFAWFGPLLELAVALLAFAGLVATLTLVSPRKLDALRRCLRTVGEPIARAVAFLTLVVFYFGVLTPIALVARRLGHDPLWLRERSRRESYWRPHRARDKSSYFHQS